MSPPPNSRYGGVAGNFSFFPYYPNAAKHFLHQKSRNTHTLGLGGGRNYRKEGLKLLSGFICAGGKISSTR